MPLAEARGGGCPLWEHCSLDALTARCGMRSRFGAKGSFCFSLRLQVYIRQLGRI